MKKRSMAVICSSFIGTAAIFSGCSDATDKKAEAAAQKPDPAQVVVTVDGISQTWDDMNKHATSFLNDEITANHLMIPENKREEALRHFHRKAIRTFVFKTVLLNEAKREKIVVQDADRAQSLKILERTLAAKNWNTNDFFNNGPMDPATMRREFEESIVIDKLLYTKVYKNIKVEKEEIDSQISSINATNRVISARLKEIREQIVSGKTEFADAARTFSRDRYASKGGDFGEIARDGRRLNKALEKHIFGLNAGEMSEVLCDKGYYVIYKVISKAPAREKTATTPAIPETAHLACISLPCVPVNRIKIIDAIRKVKCDRAAAAYYTELLKQASVSCPLFPDMKFIENSAAAPENLKEAAK